MERILEQVYKHKSKFEDDPLNNSYLYWCVGLAYDKPDLKDLINNKLMGVEIKTLKIIDEHKPMILKKVYNELVQDGYNGYKKDNRQYDKGKILFFFRMI